MSEVDTSRTAIDRLFAGRSRRFQLRIGEIGELERICGAGIGEIMLRLAAHRFRAADIWATIRLGLEGGGEREIVATGLVERYQSQPLGDYIQLAADIISAAVAGVPPPKPATEGASDDPATSPSSTTPGAAPD